MRTLIWTVILSLAVGGAAAAAPMAGEKCQAAKLDALRKRAFCRAGERRKEVLGATPDPAKCDDKFVKAIGKADEQAAKSATACRWLTTGDGTATDLNTGLQWELKTDDGTVHDKDNAYTWTATPGGLAPDGTAFTEFLVALDAGSSDDGTALAGCFADKCDWRLPNIVELRSILTACTVDGCTTIPGETAPGIYWSASTFPAFPRNAWLVRFSDGLVGQGTKTDADFVRAVRGDP